MESEHLLTCSRGDDVTGGQGGNLMGTEDDTDHVTLRTHLVPCVQLCAQAHFNT